MTTPGSNLFAQAIRLIAPTRIQYFEYTGRTQNAARQWVASFAEPVELIASVQMVPRAKYVQYGLDFQRQYIKVWASQDFIDLARDASGDKFTWGGSVYQLESQNTWFLQDGWASCMAVEIGPITDDIEHIVYIKRNERQRSN